MMFSEPCRLLDAQRMSSQWQVCGRSVRVDHVENYRLPKQLQENEEHANAPPDLSKPGLAYHGHDLASSYSLIRGQDLFATTGVGTVKDDKSKQETGGRDSDDGSDNDGRLDDSVRRRKRPRSEKSHRKGERPKKAKKGSKEEKSKKKKKRRRSDSSDGS